MYQAAVAVHIPSAVVWLGGMLFLAMVMLPAARKAMQSGGPGEGLDVLRNADKSFRPVAGTEMGLLGLSGAYLAWEHVGMRPGVFFTDGVRDQTLRQASRR